MNAIRSIGSGVHGNVALFVAKVLGHVALLGAVACAAPVAGGVASSSGAVGAGAEEAAAPAVAPPTTGDVGHAPASLRAVWKLDANDASLAVDPSAKDPAPAADGALTCHASAAFGCGSLCSWDAVMARAACGGDLMVCGAYNAFSVVTTGLEQTVFYDAATGAYVGTVVDSRGQTFCAGEEGRVLPSLDTCTTFQKTCAAPGA